MKFQNTYLKRIFLWYIFSIKDSNMANKFISHSLKQRNLDDTEGEWTVEVSEDVLNLLHGVHYFSNKKGKALFCSLHQKS